jgi:hypothetical protein
MKQLLREYMIYILRVFSLGLCEVIMVE